MVCPADKAPYSGLIVTEPDRCGVGGAPDGGGVLGGAGITEPLHPAALRIRQEIHVYRKRFRREFDNHPPSRPAVMFKSRVAKK
jgi:hypothetical protein